MGSGTRSGLTCITTFELLRLTGTSKWSVMTGVRCTNK